MENVITQLNKLEDLICELDQAMNLLATSSDSNCGHKVSLLVHKLSNETDGLEKAIEREENEILKPIVSRYKTRVQKLKQGVVRMEKLMNLYNVVSKSPNYGNTTC